jgi:hypothetical protein
VNPVVVHVVRPYASEQDYLAAEAWSIDARSMLLIDADPLAADTPVLFDVALEDGHKPIRAEGRVVGMVAAQADRPGGMKVRFKRFGAATKAFIERAVKARAEAPSRPGTDPGSAPAQDRPSSVEVERPSSPEVERLSMPEVRQSMTELEAVVIPVPPVQAPPVRDSGLQRRVPGPVSAPANRDELLARLRQRRQAG